MLAALSEKLEELLKTIPFRVLERASQELSEAYREQSDGIKKSKPFMAKYEHKLAYLALRMPATYAAVYNCLEKIPFPIQSLLDVGSGPGTAFLAAQEIFPRLQRVDLVERDQELIQIGQKLSSKAHYLQQDMHNFVTTNSYDLITAAYALSELPEEHLTHVVNTLWQAGNCICIVEPGTPYGFKRIHQIRSQLISLGAHILAPCTHEAACPLAHSDDWCHFAVRFSRPQSQRLVKGASLGYEDEKYSYLIATKKPYPQAYARIIKTPSKHSGHVRLTLCTSHGLENKLISRRDGELYKEARKLDWGDIL